MPPLENDEEVKVGKGVIVLTLNKLLIRLSILLGKIKAANNSYNLKTKLGKYYIFWINTIKSRKNFTVISSCHYNNCNAH